MIMNVIALILGYMVGSIPSGHWIAQMRGVTIYDQGSGNIGATNMGRILGYQYFIFTLFADAAKAAALLYALALISSSVMPLYFASMALVIGNSCSFFLAKEKQSWFENGGKGIATALGCLIILHPTLAFIALVSWMSALAFIKIVGMASVVAALIVPLIVWYLIPDTYLLYTTSFMGLWICMRHRANIADYMKKGRDEIQ